MMEFSSDCESIRTEDFVSKFCEYVSPETCKDSGFSCGKSDCVTPIPREERIPNFSSYKSEALVLKNETRTSLAKPIYHETLDLDSVATEIFDDQLHRYQESQLLSGRSFPAESCNTSLHLGNLSNVQPMRRDIMNKFLSKYTLDEEKIETQIKNLPLYLQKIKNVKPQNGKNEVNWKTGFNRNQHFKLRPSNDLANDIRNKSLQIQNEIHEERKRKLESIQEMNNIREKTPREQLDIKVKELDQLTDRMRKARADREKISEELDSLRNNLKDKSSELRSEQRCKNKEKITEDNVLYETRPTKQSMQTSQNQLIHLNAQLCQKKSYLKDLEERIRQRICEIQNLESIGLSKQEIQHVIEERNELYEILRLSEENGNDRYELEKKLTDVKEELSLEHKRSRETIMKLEEELDNSYKKINCVYEERDNLSKELIYYKEMVQTQQDDINAIYTERNDLRYQIEKYKEEIDSQRCISREMIEQERKRYESHLATEEAQTKMIVSELKSQLLALESENTDNVENVLTSRTRLNQLEKECSKLRNSLESQENEFRERTETLEDEKNQTIEKYKREFYSKKENEIQNLKIELDSEQIRTVNNLKECYKQQNADLQNRLENKLQEVQDLKCEHRRIKQEFVEKEISMKNHYESEILKMQQESKRNFEKIEEKRFSDVEELKERYEGLLNNISKEINEERGMNERLRSALDKANKDIIQESEMTKKLKNEKALAISKLKETAKEKLQEEFKKIKEFYEKEIENQLKTVEQSMQEKNSQLILKSKEIKSLQSEFLELEDAFRNNFNDIFEAIKYQCSQMAKEGKFVSPSFKNIKITDEVDIPDVTHLLIKNFQICCQEYSQYYQEFVEKVKDEKDMSVRVMEEKTSRDIQIIKEQILKDHADELNSLNLYHKQELNAFQRTHHEEIENLRRNVKEWKQKTADRLSQKLQKEFRKELEKKSTKGEINRSSSLSLQSFKQEVDPGSLKPIGLIEDLRLNIKQLRDENLSLRKVIMGQNVSHLAQNDEKNESFYNGRNGSPNIKRPQSVTQDNYKQRHESFDSSITRSGSYRNLKQ